MGTREPKRIGRLAVAVAGLAVGGVLLAQLAGAAPAEQAKERGRPPSEAGPGQGQGGPPEGRGPGGGNPGGPGGGNGGGGNGGGGGGEDPTVPTPLERGEVDGGALAVLGAEHDAVFWHTPVVVCEDDEDPSNVSGPPTCADTSFTWTFELEAAVERLRVDMDYPYRQDDHVLTVTTPDGETLRQASSNTYSHGVVDLDAPAGEYAVQLQVSRTAGSIVRLRAGITPPAEVVGTEVDGEVLVLPNLRVTPPFELGFAAPINPANSTFTAGDDQNPGVVIGDDPLYSCTPDEVQEAADPTRYPVEELTVLTRCLRFTAGPHNVGEGHMDLRFPIVTRATGGDTDRIEEMTQYIRDVDGGLVTRPAGTYEYHVTHGHYHYLDILFYELLAVDEEAGTVTPAGVGHKSGFCPADQGYGDWTDFDQDVKNTVGGEQGASCFALTGDGALGLTAGWGDFYRWQRPGQFVDFSGQPDGLYVVRATVDVLDNVLESDETDNASYAYVRVTGEQVELLERGYGESPFDPGKRVAVDNRGQPPVQGLVRPM